MTTATNRRRLTDLEADERRREDEEELSIVIEYVDLDGRVVETLPAMRIVPGAPFDYWRTVGRIPVRPDDLTKAPEADT